MLCVTFLSGSTFVVVHTRVSNNLMKIFTRKFYYNDFIWRADFMETNHFIAAWKMLQLFTLLLLLLHLFYVERDACCASQVDFDQMDVYTMQKKRE